MSKEKDTLYIPDGKRETGESDQQALIREVKEELTVDLIPDTMRKHGVFEAPAHGKPEGTFVRMTCYMAEFTGTLTPSSEIEKLDFFSHDQKSLTFAVDHLIFDDLKKNI